MQTSTQVSSAKRPTVHCAFRKGQPLRVTGSTSRADCRRRIRQSGKSRSVQCNELNPWGDTSGEECNAGQDENSFERDTCGTLLRVLTAKATQRIIQQLMELNLTKAHWLQMFCSKHPPLEGDKFIVALMNERPSSSTDRVLFSTELINPAELAVRILLVRKDLAVQTSKMMPNFVERDNLEVQRHHLEKNSYTSGSHDKGKRSTRGSHSPHDPKDASKKRWFAS